VSWAKARELAAWELDRCHCALPRRGWFGGPWEHWAELPPVGYDIRLGGEGVGPSGQNQRGME
jgi:hypothetical protein